ncbi:MAG: GlsB/YeaQ/YmgE family stress response membrane protein [bacterium]|nr:GlsB/YeaQ/YmgE family stress response membrane protein [bacterium]
MELNISLLWFLIIGIVAGWLAGVIMKGRGFGLIGNLIVGVIGAFLGPFLLKQFGITTYGLIGSLVAALIGALVLLFIIGLFKKK